MLDRRHLHLLAHAVARPPCAGAGSADSIAGAVPTRRPGHDRTLLVGRGGAQRTLAEQSDLTAEFASAWQAADKVVYSTTLTAVPTATTRLERDFEPDAVRQLKAVAGSDLTIGGADLAAQAFTADLVDECQLFVWPAIVGVGKPALPADIRTDLELLDGHRFDNGVMYLRYRVPTYRPVTTFRLGVAERDVRHRSGGDVRNDGSTTSASGGPRGR